MNGNGGLLERVEIQRVMNSVAAGTTAQNGTGVDMTGYRGVMFVLAVGTLTATQVTNLKAQQSSDNSNWDDLEGTTVGPYGDDDDNDLLVLDVYKPTDRYVRPVVGRGTANAVIDGVIAVLYDPIDVPTSQGATVIDSELHVSPDEGTA